MFRIWTFSEIDFAEPLIPDTFIIGFLDSTILFLFCDLTSTLTCFEASTTNSLSQGVKYVSSAITSNLRVPVTFSPNNPPNFFIGTLQSPCDPIVPLYKRFTFSEQPSYRLDAIGEYEVGEKKVAYDGTLNDLY